jgi:hypothetical protein
MFGFTLVSRSYYHLRRRRSKSRPLPPFPPDHRQAGERGAILAYFIIAKYKRPSTLLLFRGAAASG